MLYAQKDNSPQLWEVKIQLKERNVIVNLEVLTNQKQEIVSASIFTHQEKIVFDKVETNDKTITFYLDIFDTALQFEKSNQFSQMTGKWIRFGFKEPYEIPMIADISTIQNNALENTKKNAAKKLNGRWEVNFEDKSTAIAEFKNLETNALAGTFLTTTGDYRFLEGFDSFENSTNKGNFTIFGFNGASAIVVEGSFEGENMTGTIHSGKTSIRKFTAKKNQNAQLPDAYQITSLKKGYDKLAFQFPNLDKKNISLEDKKFKNKVLIIQLSGSWCPNCMDETAYISPWYDKNKKRGIEVIALFYERSNNFETAKTRVEKLKKRFDVNYETLIAGTNDKQTASTTLPMLNEINAYPTTIFIDKKGKVRKIHTGFSGPATGEHYLKWQEEFNDFVDKLVSEK
jgi:thiol-disulfide isomerase/thioredoxin